MHKKGVLAYAYVKKTFVIIKSLTNIKQKLENIRAPAKIIRDSFRISHYCRPNNVLRLYR